MNHDELGAALRRVLADADPLPPGALESARAALGWRDLDAQLARLLAVPDRELAGLRGHPRLLSFTAGQVVIDVEVSSDDGTVRLLGQLEPAGEAEIIIESAAEPRVVVADGHGRFSTDELPDSWLRIVVTAGDPAGQRTVTEWFRA
jgi:predicted dinucleotide-binding enzyme